jgi:hypothetical protein
LHVVYPLLGLEGMQELEVSMLGEMVGMLDCEQCRVPEEIKSGSKQ